MRILEFDRLVGGWKGLYDYFERLTAAREAVEGYARYEGPLGRVRKALLAGRFYMRNKLILKRNIRRLAMARDASTPDRTGSEPLVSIVIPTRDRCSLLMERAIPSALRQTYPNVELIVIGDRCTDDTEQTVAALEDPKVKYFNLPETMARPRKGFEAWLVAGIDPSNMGLRISSGDWIVHLDDDDELAPEHVEVLPRFAIENELEMAYAKVVAVEAGGERVELGSFPPELGRMTHSGALFSSRVKFFEYDRNGWRYLEPGDWCLWRRMKEAGVRMGFLDRVLGTIYPAGPASY